MTDRKQQTSSTQCRVASTVPSCLCSKNYKHKATEWFKHFYLLCQTVPECTAPRRSSLSLHSYQKPKRESEERGVRGGGEAQRKVENRKSRIIRRTKWSQTLFKTKQEVLKTRLYEAGERPTTDALTFCSELFKDAHSLKPILQPSSPLKKWQPDRNVFSFQSMSKNVLWKSNQDKIKGSTSFQPPSVIWGRCFLSLSWRRGHRNHYIWLSGSKLRPRFFSSPCTCQRLEGSNKNGHEASEKLFVTFNSTQTLWRTAVICLQQCFMFTKTSPTSRRLCTFH